MEKIGKPVPASKAGVTAVTKALAEYLGVDTNRTGYGAVDEMRAKLKAMLSAQHNDGLIAAENAAKNGVDRRVAEPLNYGAIIEGEANRIFALHTQVALD